jgi:hypothetical protein
LDANYTGSLFWKEPGNLVLQNFLNSKCLNLSAFGNGNARNNDFGYDEIRNMLSDRFVFSHGADIVRLIRASHVACNHTR